MRERLVELIIKSVDGCARHWAEVIADYLLQNGIIVPPCKVGDTVYRIERDKILETQVINMYMRFDLFDEINNPWLTIDGKDFNVFWADIGTLVFITREEAEKALKESGQ